MNCLPHLARFVCLNSAVRLVALACSLGLLGCGKPTEAKRPDSGVRVTEFATNVIAYQVRGILREIRSGGAKALIAHEEIPGYMEAMTMQLDARDTNELSGVSVGDQITFRLLTTEDDAWIDRVKRTGLRFTVESSAANDEPGDDELPLGSPLPDFGLTNQFGRAFRLSDFKGRALAFTFIFTRCPLPTFCPRMSGNFSITHRRLLEDTSQTNWHLISISFDSDYDTPGELAKYARSYQPDSNHWSFATSSADIIHQLGGNFGLTFVREGATFNHNVRTVVVDTAGRIQKVFAGNGWQPAELIAEMKAAMRTGP